MARNNWEDLMSLIKLSIQKTRVLAKLFSFILHPHIRSSVPARPPLRAPSHLSLKPISATALQRHVAVADSEDDIFHANLHYCIISLCCPNTLFPPTPW